MRNRTHKAWQTDDGIVDNLVNLKCSYGNQKMDLQFYGDTIDEWKLQLETILTFVGFHPENIRDFFSQEDMIQKQCLEDVVCNSGHGSGCDCLPDQKCDCVPDEYHPLGATPGGFGA